MLTVSKTEASITNVSLLEPPQSSEESPKHFIPHWVSADASTAVEDNESPHQHSLGSVSVKSIYLSLRHSGVED